MLFDDYYHRISFAFLKLFFIFYTSLGFYNIINNYL